ncbi:chemotaxis-specific protein-glutamate methyltransferase CheB [Roseomonas frigidaquae]|uniref:Protein-glutamate methylesterase/protein-glutamine glutaminase n=1 Tax=Falsiroseomonas frigidaquae TaxID=487318 RepID=A0ABX1F1S0_9PROT|nr:chemotaxis-specific protein-glutamate methyltransferase CheB [Falsiroseomonas frigidaquae]NKE46298.1 chemotaxis-specific protein-glutamate methyltransferase CheB [Falsiroseomonas frigidaquae]
MPKLLIADDSALMRKFLGEIFRIEGDFELAFARNGLEALAMAHSFAPDVITLDVNMPEMDGITCLSRIMVECPKPVVMVSSLTSQGAEVTLQALSLGAIDFIAKPDGTVSLHIDKIRGALVSRVRNAASTRIRASRNLLERLRHGAEAGGTSTARASRGTVARVGTGASGPVRGVVLIGVSTGGPSAIETILPRLAEDFPWPIVVAQHMPESFTGVFARRIDSLCQIRVVEVSRATPLAAGMAYVGRGDADIVLTTRAGALHAVPMPASARHVWHPSVERLVTSAMDQVPVQNLLGVMLTGMGDDGAEAMTDLRARGGRTIAEAEETAVVWGMPGELVRRGGANLVLPLHRIADQMARWTN